MYTLKLLRGARHDLDNLDGSQRKLVDKSLRKIEKMGMHAGELLRGDLSGCRKLKHKKAGLRVVFREASGHIEIIEIVAIGKRSDSEVYKIASKRILE
ncbi:type II toxin-antitoxin system RelE/ParE family toxin [Alkalibacterium iburiense]|uniref:Type II toxin-antitoxin system RelE/ParE family toxin n=1 Tax=Alkalibacterium iburiense TaxID=290589 RepID=A0ABN0XK21_9LACT